MEKITPRFPTCKPGFIDFGRLSALHRFNDHLDQAHNIRCFEWDLFSHLTHICSSTQGITMTIPVRTAINFATTDVQRCWECP